MLERKFHWQWLLAALLSWEALAGCTARAVPQDAAPRLQLAPCRVKGFGRDVQCGTLRVFEDRASRRGRTIDLRVVVLPALARDAQPDPIFLLAGGPGQAATEAFVPLLPALAPLRKARDLVLVDQRGTGRSRPLKCELISKDADLKARLEAQLKPEQLRACLAGLDADPRLYTTSIAMDDLDEVRAALGYQRLNLWGGSYGTRAALVYARRHPARLRSMVLDGVAPVSLRLPLYFARDAQRSLELLIKQCEADLPCARRFPHLLKRFEALLLQLDKKPEVARLEDPLTGAPVELAITRHQFVEHLRGLLYSPELTALLPLTLERAAGGDFRPFVAEVDGAAPGRDSLAVGMFLSVICAEDAPFIAAEEIERLAQGSFLGAHQARELLEACKVWPRGEVPAGFREPVRSSAPALLLSGELDPATPPSWAEEALQTLPNGVHLIAPGVGHGVTMVGCVPNLLRSFYDKGSAEGLDVSCVRALRRPPFFVGFAGPQP